MQKWRLLSSSRLSYCADWLIVKKTTITLKTKQLNLKIQRSCDHVVSYNTYISSPTWLYPFYSIFLSYWLIQQMIRKTKIFISEVVAQRCFVIKVFLEISQNSQENTCARVSFLIKLQALNLWWMLLSFKRYFIVNKKHALEISHFRSWVFIIFKHKIIHGNISKIYWCNF